VDERTSSIQTVLQHRSEGQHGTGFEIISQIAKSEWVSEGHSVNGQQVQSCRNAASLHRCCSIYTSMNMLILIDHVEGCFFADDVAIWSKQSKNVNDVYKHQNLQCTKQMQDALSLTTAWVDHCA